jgi:hypothetical protein
LVVPLRDYTFLAGLLRALLVIKLVNLGFELGILGIDQLAQSSTFLVGVLDIAAHLT